MKLTYKEEHAHSGAYNVYIKAIIINTHQFNNDSLFVIMCVAQMFQGHKGRKMLKQNALRMVVPTFRFYFCAKSIYRAVRKSIC